MTMTAMKETKSPKKLVAKLFRCSKDESDQILSIAKSEGYRTQSEFIRARILKDDFNLHLKINRIESIVSDILTELPMKKKSEKEK
jgi:hypothetical protein